MKEGNFPMSPRLKQKPDRKGSLGPAALHTPDLIRAYTSPAQFRDCATIVGPQKSTDRQKKYGPSNEFMG